MKTWTTSAVYAVNSAVQTSIVATACATTSTLVATAFVATTLLTTTKTEAAVPVTLRANRKRVRVYFVKWRPVFSPCVQINHLSFILWTLYRSFHLLDRPSTPGRRVKSQACSDTRGYTIRAHQVIQFGNRVLQTSSRLHQYEESWNKYRAL